MIGASPKTIAVMIGSNHTGLCLTANVSTATAIRHRLGLSKARTCDTRAI
jgi:hypothetical protein